MSFLYHPVKYDQYPPYCKVQTLVTAFICRADEVFRAEEGAEEILAVAKDHLLQGLADDNRDLK